MTNCVINPYTYLLTPWCRVLLEKPTGLQLVKKFPAFVWNPKVHHSTHKRPPTVPVLGQPNRVQIPTSHLLEIHPNIILILAFKCSGSRSRDARHNNTLQNKTLPTANVAYTNWCRRWRHSALQYVRTVAVGGQVQ